MYNILCKDMGNNNRGDGTQDGTRQLSLKDPSAELLLQLLRGNHSKNVDSKDKCCTVIKVHTSRPETL